MNQLILSTDAFSPAGYPSSYSFYSGDSNYVNTPIPSGTFDTSWSGLGTFVANFGVSNDEEVLFADLTVELSDVVVTRESATYPIPFGAFFDPGVVVGNVKPYGENPGKFVIEVNVKGAHDFTATALVSAGGAPLFAAEIIYKGWLEFDGTGFVDDGGRLAVTLIPINSGDFWQRKIGTDEPTFSRLKKRPVTTRVAAVLATPGTPGTPGRPATPARTILVPRTVSASSDLVRLAENMARTKYYFETTRFTTAAEFNAAQQAYSDAIAAYNSAPKNISDAPTTTTVYDSVFIPAQPATPAVPGTAGTAGSAAKTLINTNAGLNSSGSTGLLPANVALEFVVSRAAVSVYAGFSATQGVVGRRNIVWGFYFERGTFKVVQNSVLVGSFLPFDSGDTFTVVRANGQIRYLRNNLAVAI